MNTEAPSEPRPVKMAVGFSIYPQVRSAVDEWVDLLNRREKKRVWRTRGDVLSAMVEALGAAGWEPGNVVAVVRRTRIFRAVKQPTS